MTITGPQEIVERALELSKADGCIAIADTASSANLRWAGNTLTTNGVVQGRQLTVVATVGGATGVCSGVVSRSGVGLDEVEALVRAAEQAARDNGPAEDAAALVTPDEAADPGTRWDEPPPETSIDVFGRFAPDLGAVFEQARSADRLLYGFAEHKMTTTYVGTSTGLRLRHDQPTGSVEINAKAAKDLTRSAWVGTQTRDFTDVNVGDLDAQLAQRLAWGQRRVDLPAGRYETLLPPAAVADLMIYLLWSSGARDAHDGRTVFSRPGGGTRVGETLSQTPLTLRSNAAEPGMECAPFVLAHASGGEWSVFDNGLAVAPTDWIRDGVLNALVQTRHSAALTGLPVTPVIDNLILEAPGGGQSLDEMVAATGRGLLLTCLWYIRVVDPQNLLLTGLTRDGVYLVEDGEVTGEVNNFRFNESPVDLFGRFAEVGATERTLPREFKDYFTRTAMPAVRVADFNMSSVSQAS